MTGPDLIRLAEELARCGGVHRLTALVTAAVHVALEHERRHRPPCVEDWETGPHGVGMSDKTTGPRRPVEVPERTGLHGGPPGYPNMRGVSVGVLDPLASILPHSGKNCAESANPAPVMPERGERVPLHPEKGPRQKISVDQSFGHPDTAKAGTSGPMGASMFRTGNALAEERGGIVHMPGSKVAAEFGPSDPATRRVPKPVNPEDCGDGA